MSEQPIKIRSDAPPETMVFRMSDDSECGTLSLSENGKMQFHGDVEESAKILFNYVCNYYNAQQAIVEGE